MDRAKAITDSPMARQVRADWSAQGAWTPSGGLEDAPGVVGQTIRKISGRAPEDATWTRIAGNTASGVRQATIHATDGRRLPNAIGWIAIALFLSKAKPFTLLGVTAVGGAIALYPHVISKYTNQVNKVRAPMLNLGGQLQGQGVMILLPLALITGIMERYSHVRGLLPFGTHAVFTYGTTVAAGLGMAPYLVLPLKGDIRG